MKVSSCIVASAWLLFNRPRQFAHLGINETTGIAPNCIAPDVGPINSSLRVLSVDVSGGRASFTLAFDVSDKMRHICMLQRCRQVLKLGGLINKAH